MGLGSVGDLARFSVRWSGPGRMVLRYYYTPGGGGGRRTVTHNEIGTRHTGTPQGEVGGCINWPMCIPEPSKLGGTVVGA